jgi:large repetitive protein
LHVTAPELASQVAAQPGNKQATVKWVPPALHGGLPVTGYVITPYIGHTALASHTFHSTVRHQLIGGLSNGRTYVFKVAVMNKLGTGPNALSSSQINALGTGPTSTASPAIKIGAPTAPAVVKASASKTIAGAAVLQFSGASGNGSPITRYTAVCVSRNGGRTRSAVATNTSARTIVVTGLTVGKAYVCSITATNKRGDGPATASNRVTT